MTPGRLPLDFVNGLIGFLAELINGAEPLFGCTEDDGMVAAPAMRVLVGDVLHAHQVAGLLDVLQNNFVGSPDLKACKLFACFFGQVTAIVHGDNNGNLRVVVDADFKVLNTVARCGMNAAGAAFQGNVVTQDNQALAVQEGVLILHQLKFRAENAGLQNLVILDMAGFHGGFHQTGSHQVIFIADFDEGILQAGVQAGCHVGGQGPGGGGPDHDPCLVQRDTVLGQNTVGVIGELKADIDRIALVLGILDFGFCQSSTILRAPVNGFHALVDIAFLGHLAKDLHLACLKFGAQGQVGVGEIALNAQAGELAVHHINMLGSKLFADLAQFQLGNAGLFIAQRGQSLQLNGQTVGIIARNIGSTVARHVLFTDDDILDDLVQGSTHMDITVGIRRAIMQNKARQIRVMFDHFFVDVVFLPILQHFGFLFRQPGTHFKGGSHLMDGIIVILRQSFQLSSISLL